MFVGLFFLLVSFHEAGMEARLTGQSVALGLVLVPLAVEIQRATLAVGQLAAHLLVTHRTVGEVFHILCGKKGRRERTHEVNKSSGN